MTRPSLGLPTSLNTRLIGYDRLFNQLEDFWNTAGNTVNNYPPYNLVKVDEHNYRIELAVAGFSEKDIEVTLEDQQLSIRGLATPQVEMVGTEYLHQGISARNWERSFKLAENVNVTRVNLSNGILIVMLEHVVPEEKKARKLEIEVAKS